MKKYVLLVAVFLCPVCSALAQEYAGSVLRSNENFVQQSQSSSFWVDVPVTISGHFYFAGEGTTAGDLRFGFTSKVADDIRMTYAVGWGMSSVSSGSGRNKTEGQMHALKMPVRLEYFLPNTTLAVAIGPCFNVSLGGYINQYVDYDEYYQYDYDSGDFGVGLEIALRIGAVEVCCVVDKNSDALFGVGFCF